MKECNVSGTACIDRDSRENSGVIHIKEEEENDNFEIIILIMNLSNNYLYMQKLNLCVYEPRT